MSIKPYNQTEELQRVQEELFTELDKGIRDMENGNLISCEEAIRQILKELNLYDE